MANTLLKELQHTTAANDSRFDTFIGVLKEVASSGFVLLDSDPTTELIAEMESHKRKCTISDPVVTVSDHPKPSTESMSVIPNETATVASKVKVIEMFTEKLVPANSDDVDRLSDHCLSKELISGEVYRRLFELTNGEERARKLLIVIRNNIHSDDRCFNILFLNALKETLPPIMHKLISEIKAESEKVQSAPALAVNGSLSDLPPEVDENLKLLYRF